MDLKIKEIAQHCAEKNRQYYEDSRLLTEREASKHLTEISYEKLKGSKLEGITVADYDKKGQRTLLIAPPSHALVVGCTGSGKSQCHTLPMIEKIAVDGCGSSFITVDVKGELCQKTVPLLRRNGYEVKILNFNEPTCSVRFNPLALIYQYYMRARGLEKTANRAIDRDSRKAAEVLKQKSEVNLLDDYCMTEINKLCEILIPIESVKETSWDYGAREIVRGIIIGMLETAALYPKEMPLSKFTIANICNIAFTKDDDYRSVRRWYSSLGEKSIAKRMLSQYYELAARQTRDSYISSATSKLQRYYGLSFQMLTADNEIDVVNVTEELERKKLAIFVIIDDSRTETYSLCLLFLNQLLLNLRTKAKKSMEKRLKNEFYFLLDEFCNMPAFPEIEKWITTLRSVGIRLLMVIQSYFQLSERYGEGVANIVKGNCDLRIFMGSRDIETLTTVSKEAGETCGVSAHYSIGNAGDVSVSISPTNVPLIKVSDLTSMKLGEQYVFYCGKVMALHVKPYFLRNPHAEEFFYGSEVRSYFDPEEFRYDTTSIKRLHRADPRQFDFDLFD